MKITKNSVISATLFALLVATLMALEEFYEGEMSATTAFEEVLAYLSILGMLFLFIVVPFQKFIERLNTQLSWKKAFFKRIGMEALLVGILSVCLGFIFGNFIHLYIDHVLPVAAVILRTILFLLITSSIIMALLELQQLQEEKEDLVILSERLEKEKIETLYHSLKQQVNPHFLFNSLSVLSSLVYVDAEKADLFIQHFSDIYRYVLDLNEKQVVRLDEELEFLESYLFLQQIRFGNTIQLKTHLSEVHKQAYLPPLSLQLVFENILKHNIISTHLPMSITMKVQDNQLVIQNALRPKKVNNSMGIGTQNLTEKYKLLNRPAPTFEKGATTYTVFLPLLEKKMPTQ